MAGGSHGYPAALVAIPHFDVEGIYQFGSFGAGNIRAWALATEFGCILPKIAFEPRPGIRADVSSGDNNLSSPNLQTFNPLFPVGNYFGVLSDTGPERSIFATCTRI
jgi:Alginate export